MVRYLVKAIAFLVVLVAIVVGIGASLPVAHTVSRQATYRASPSQLFALIRNVGDYPSWQKAVTKVEILADTNGHARVRETNSGQAITYEFENIVPDHGLVSRIADRNLPFGGSWTYEIVPGSDANATTLRITEHGEVYNIVFRFVSKFIMGHSSTIDKYLEAVATRYPRIS
jgi:hypothetical protein